ncbi:hypothetical protein K437DRAFT_270325 [Tilletiaria anomala UBC 951]|uniref:PIN domain-containing protein n=1 Tax=Tilletiaria anomala (strain ATCC 24038 / CBS 436.72 / UBC 951) TaxID=1037660 RepID=A0A066VD03_TILAU|nr:uncharacterized protein K437DRAFT_270325 [Tilletiaria anomala UBC 951]KDN39321.1 hypothetical protein K437DRAFT_270325 [Tilletiaria anomala UBC 951]
MPREESDAERAERQARLSHAMGKLFLSDRIAKMEDEATTLELRRKPAASSQKGPSPSHGANNSTKSRGTGNSEGMAHGDSSKRGPGRGLRQQQPQGPIAVRIIDVSLLIYSLRTLHDWIKERRYRLVVPLEALNVLDVLKKGDMAINIAARKAMRFLDERIISLPNTASSSDTFRPQGQQPQFVVQNDTERINWSDIVAHVNAGHIPAVDSRVQLHVDPSTNEAAKAQSIQAANDLLVELIWDETEESGRSVGAPRHQNKELLQTSNAAAQSSSESKPSNDGTAFSSGGGIDTDAPLHVRETLSCFAWWECKLRYKMYGSSSAAQQACAANDDKDTLALAIALPPPDSDDLITPRPAAETRDVAVSRFHIRADGRLMKRYAEEAGMNVIVAPTAASWLQIAHAGSEVSAHSSDEQPRPAKGRPAERKLRKSAAAVASLAKEDRAYDRGSTPQIIFSK